MVIDTKSYFISNFFGIGKSLATASRLVMEKKDEPKKADMYDLAIRNSNNDVNTLKVSEGQKNSYLDSGNNIMTNTDGRQLSFKPEGIPM